MTNVISAEWYVATLVIGGLIGIILYSQLRLNSAEKKINDARKDEENGIKKEVSSESIDELLSYVKSKEPTDKPES
jgi:uncharacterized membrane protein YqgA involved in biofilm formation